jgi:hypothetical protein
MHQEFLPPGIVILTGAGISKESGIDTFRDKDGLWARVNLEEVATIEAWHRDKKKVLDFYNDTRRSFRAAHIEPNAAHRALAYRAEGDAGCHQTRTLPYEQAARTSSTCMAATRDPLHELQFRLRLRSIHAAVGLRQLQDVESCVEHRGSSRDTGIWTKSMPCWNRRAAWQSAPGEVPAASFVRMCAATNAAPTLSSTSGKRNQPLFTNTSGLPQIVPPASGAC